MAPRTYGDDSNVFVDDVTAHHGNATAGEVWWLSPDIEITGPTPNILTRNATNQVVVRGRSTTAANIKVEAYIGNPSLAMGPGTNTVRIPLTNASHTMACPGPTGATWSFGFNPDGGASGAPSPSDPALGVDVPGGRHRCMVVCAYPFGVTPTSGTFTPWAEQHEGQHNIDVQFAGESGSMEGDAGTMKNPAGFNPDNGMIEAPIETISLRDEGTEKVRILVAFDPNPRGEVFRAAWPLVAEDKRFKTFGDSPPKVGIEFEKADARVLQRDEAFTRFERDLRRERFTLFRRKRALLQAEAELEPDTKYRLKLQIDPRDVAPHQPLVFHLKQIGEDGSEQGGLTQVITLVG
jgi:hypothetical protein